jgi:hypothetical protein
METNQTHIASLRLRDSSEVLQHQWARAIPMSRLELVDGAAV